MSRSSRVLTALFSTAIVMAMGVTAIASAKPRHHVEVFPVPRTHVAATKTTLSFVGVKPGKLGKVIVKGSKTGRHFGTREAHPGGNGVSFIPKKRFASNERITVRTNLNLRNADHGDYWFKTGNFNLKPKKVPPLPPEGDVPPNSISYHSRPDIHVPKVTIDTPAAAGVSPGYVFMAPKADGPMIVDNQGNLVWYHDTPANNFKVQTYRGKRVLTLWQQNRPDLSLGVGRGFYALFDNHYNVIKRVNAGNGYSGDVHEFRLTPRGTALLTAYRLVRKNLKRFGGNRRGAVLDSVAQEVDVRTGLVLWEWHSLGTVSPKESMTPAPKSRRTPWDYFHINSVSVAGDGNILISARNTSTIYKVNKATGRIMWRLGGKNSSFKQGKGTRTAWQHDAVRQQDGLLTVFDNGAAPPIHKRSRALFLKLTGKGRKVEVEKAFTHPTKLLANSQGDVQVLPNGNVFVGWGSEPYFTEFSSDGKVLFDGHFAARNSSYRSFRYPWVGEPDGRPAIASKAQSGGKVTAWASWNGDTRVAAWRLLGGPSPDKLAPLGVAIRDGFETAVTAAAKGSTYVAMQGVDASGKVLGTSAVTKVGQQSE